MYIGSYVYTQIIHYEFKPSTKVARYGTDHIQCRTCEQILSEHSCYHQRVYTSPSVSARW